MINAINPNAIIVQLILSTPITAGIIREPRETSEMLAEIVDRARSLDRDILVIHNYVRG